ncbi:hypothetical protein QSJ19_03070 [Gordonia sp. ABSL11-1]|uniref:hypothetical protein n=1 Tax=Gordonia sp. ABSL11-1 TaxID=3053924 RepID=UPI002573EA26|nr:hypothetical protein [Gordonia sp. ABSL11-1]MDL9944581.1 hypothetical protein [Gordonia sp. ABSL11-1]
MAILGALAVAAVLALMLVLTFTADSAGAETPAERCARETAAYNSAWAQSWAASHGRPASEAPNPPVPYVCHDPGPTTTTTTPPPVVTAPTVPSDTNTPEAPGPNMGAHAPTDIPAPGRTPIVDVPRETTVAPPRPGGIEPTDARTRRPNPPPRTVTPRPRPQGEQQRNDEPGCSKGYVEDGTNSNNLCREGVDKLIRHWNTKFREACPTGTATVPGHHWTDQVAHRIMTAYNSGTTNEAALENIAATSIGLANLSSAQDCHNNRNRSASCPSGGTGTAPDCMGLVAVCPMPGETRDERNQRLSYIRQADGQARNFGPLEKIQQTDANKNAAIAAARRERAAHPELYPHSDIVVGHAPDSIWGPTPESNSYIPMTRNMNSSISGQANTNYPIGYMATGFVEGTRGDSGRCITPVTGVL